MKIKKKGEDMMLNQQRLKAIELLVSGENISDTAKMVGVTRATIYQWKEQDEFKAEMERQINFLKSGIERKLLGNVNPFLDELCKIALRSESDKTRLDAITYCINRLVGTPTKMVQEKMEYRVPVKDIDLDAVLTEIEGIQDGNEEECQ